MDDIGIYEILVAEHEQMLHAYVLGIVKDFYVAEDICQDSFIQAYKQLPALKNKAAFPAWLRTIARNLACAELRRRKFEVPTDPEIIQGMEDIFLKLDVNVNPRSWQHKIAIVSNCVGKLPEKIYESCRLFYFEGKSVKEAAALLNTSVVAVLKRLERARVAITECVSRELQLEEI